MKTRDIQDELAEAFEPAPLPPIGPDGAPLLEPLRPPPPPPPRLCEAGPCRNYHRFVIQTEAEDPRPQRLPVVLPPGTPGARPLGDGTLYQAPGSFHIETHHYCYPTSGVEMRLGSLPVIQCNRWNPIVRGPQGELVWDTAEGNREGFLASQEGKRFTQEVANWRAEREREDDEAAEAERLIARSMTQAPTTTEKP